MAKIQNPTKVITGVNTRWSYANVWDAKSINGGAPKYSVSLIIPKSDTVTKVNGGRTRNLPEHAPDKWEAFKTYNKRDVEVEMSIKQKLSKFPV